MPTATSSTYQDAYAQLDGVLEPLRSIAAQIIAESNGRIGFTSGFRDHDHQTRLWNEALAKYGDPEVADNWVARPGTSHHERGMAVDFSGDMDLLRKLAAKHGLIQPMDWEPWHWELGDGQDFEGQGDVNMPFNLLDQPDANPQDVLSNRMNAILSILGSGDAGYMAPMNQDEMWKVGEQFDEDFLESNGIDSDSLFADIGGPGSAAGAAVGGVAADFGAGSKGVYQKYALKKLVEKYGLDPSEIGPLIELWNRESGWNPAADNPTSSAAGIAQKMTSIHGALEPTWQGQIDWGLDYIIGRYHSPSQALAWHNRHNWY